MSENVKLKFHQKDEWNSLFYRRALIKRKPEFKNVGNYLDIKEMKLRNRSTIYKIKLNDNFSLHHYFVCLNKCKRKCRMENYKVRKIPTSIEGLNCDQINDYLFASQRLTNKLIKEYDLINKLKEKNIGLIVNCQEEGEHPYCGTVYDDGLDPCGFGYSIPELEKNGIDVLKCGWVDYIAPDSFYHMVKIVKKMYHYIHSLNKKVLVHCHAGMGRTGSSLACYLIFEKNLKPEDARKECRKGTRKNCLGSGSQFNFCQEFAKYLEISRENFFDNKKDITIFKINEKILDVGNYHFNYFNENNYKDYVPIFLLYVFDRIIQIKNEKKIDEKTINNLLSINKINNEEKLVIKDLISNINKYNWDVINKCQDIQILSRLLYKWLNNSIKYVVNPNEISLIDESNYSLSYEKLKESSKIIIDCIKKFLDLIKDKSNGNNDNLKEFLGVFIPSLLGYSRNDSNNVNEKKNVDKLMGLLNSNYKK